MAAFRTTTIVTLLDDAIERDPRSRDAIAAEIGIAGNMLSMIRGGNTVLPADRIEAFAEVLKIPLPALIVAGIDAYADHNNAWKAMGVLMRVRLRDLMREEKALAGRPKRSGVKISVMALAS